MIVSEYIKNRTTYMVAVISVFSALTSSTLGQEMSADTKAKELIRQWVATERLLGEELNAWKQQKAQVTDLLSLYKKELKLLNEELSKTGNSVAEIDTNKAKLEAEINAGMATRKKLRAFLITLMPRVRVVENRFPSALKTQVANSMNTLNAINDETSVREILAAVVNVIEQANTFNAGIYQSSESIKIGSNTWNAEVLYLGLGRAYFYVGTKAGIGVPTANGWKWQRKDEILGDVRKAVEVFNQQKQPQLVELPVQIQNSDTK